MTRFREMNIDGLREVAEELDHERDYWAEKCNRLEEIVAHVPERERAIASTLADESLAFQRLYGKRE